MVSLSFPLSLSKIEFYILEQTTITGCNYILVTEEEEGDGECYILKETGASDGDDATYEFLEDESEFAAVGKVFSQLVEDADIEL